MTILNLKIKVLKAQHFYVVSFSFERKNFMIKSDKFKLFQPADCTPKGVTIHFLPNEDYILTYTSQYLDKPIKSNTPKILWIRPEDNLSSLFKRATLYFQQQRVWNSEDYATAIRNLFPYYSYDGSTITVEYSQLNSCFLTGIEKNEMIKKFNLKGVKRKYLSLKGTFKKFKVRSLFLLTMIELLQKKLFFINLLIFWKASLMRCIQYLWMVLIRQ